MTREWKPGEAAILRCNDAACPDVEHPGIKGRLTEWYILDRGEYMHDAEPIRPLVTIDPENDEQVERLHSQVSGCVSFGSLRSALREYADPKPPFEVYEHFVERIDSGIYKSLCGKVWQPNDNAVAKGKCPTCAEQVKAGWVK